VTDIEAKQEHTESEDDERGKVSDHDTIFKQVAEEFHFLLCLEAFG
jgi:hypothetical protein